MVRDQNGVNLTLSNKLTLQTSRRATINLKRKSENLEKYVFPQT